MVVRVKVTQDHIARGLRNNSSLCTIALALEEATGHAAIVSLYSAFLLPATPLKIFRLPDEVSIFIHRFDVGFSVQPFEFEVETEGITIGDA